MGSSTKIPAVRPRFFCPKCNTDRTSGKALGSVIACEACETALVVVSPAFDVHEHNKTLARLELTRARDELCEAALRWDEFGRKVGDKAYEALVASIWRYRAARP